MRRKGVVSRVRSLEVLLASHTGTLSRDMARRGACLLSLCIYLSLWTVKDRTEGCGGGEGFVS
jgi:hypothetical protein